MAKNASITALLDGYYARSGAENNNINLFVAEAIAYIIKNYFSKLALSFVMTLSCRDERTCNFYNEVLEKLFVIWGTPLVQIVVYTEKMSEQVPGRRHFNLILVDSFQAFLDLDVNSHSARYNYNEYYYIFLQASDNHLTFEMQRIFNYCWSHYLINCNVQVQTTKGEVFIFTYFPYTREYCGVTGPPILINEFNGSALVVDELFPKKLRNFYGCAIKGALWHVPPFVYLKNDKNNIPRITGGFEGNLLVTLGQKLNFTLDIRIPPNDEQRGRFYGDTVNGALGMFRKRTADLSLGSFRETAQRSIEATSVMGYYQSTQAVTVVGAVYDYTSLEILFYPFGIHVWTLLAAILVGCIVVLMFVNNNHLKYPHLFADYWPRHSYLNILLLLVGMPACFIPKSNYARMLCIIWIFFTLIIRTLYQGMLFHLIRTQESHPFPKTLDALIADNYVAVMNRGTYEALDDVSVRYNLKRILVNDTWETVAFEYIVKSQKKRLMAVGPLDFLLHFGTIQKLPGVFRILPQTVVSQQITMYLPKHSFLIDQFDEIIIWIRSAGLIDAWVNWEVDSAYVQSNHMITDKVYSMEELHMLFVLYLIAMICSIIVFVLERLSRNVALLKRLFEDI